MFTGLTRENVLFLFEKYIKVICKVGYYTILGNTFCVLIREKP